MDGSIGDVPRTTPASVHPLQKYDVIAFQRSSVEIAGGVVPALLLDQLTYRFTPLLLGEESPWLVQRDGQWWLALRREDARGECALSPRQFDRASAALVARGLVTKRRFRFEGSPVVHLSLNLEALTARRGERGVPPASRGNGTYPNGKMELTKTVKSLRVKSFPKSENQTPSHSPSPCPHGLTPNTEGTGVLLEEQRDPEATAVAPTPAGPAPVPDDLAPLAPTGATEEPWPPTPGDPGTPAPLAPTGATEEPWPPTPGDPGTPAPLAPTGATEEPCSLEAMAAALTPGAPAPLAPLAPTGATEDPCPLVLPAPVVPAPVPDDPAARDLITLPLLRYTVESMRAGAEGAARPGASAPEVPAAPGPLARPPACAPPPPVPTPPRANGTTVHAPATLPPPTWSNIRLEDFQDTGRYLALYPQLVQHSWLGPCQPDRLTGLALAEHVLERVQCQECYNPGGLYMELLRKPPLERDRYISPQNEDTAWRRLKVWDDRRAVPCQGHPPPTASARPALSQDAWCVRELQRELARQGFHGDVLARLRREDPAQWPQSRCDAIARELARWQQGPAPSRILELEECDEEEATSEEDAEGALLAEARR